MGQFLYEWGYAAADADGAPTGMAGGETGEIREIGHLADKTVIANTIGAGAIGTTATIDFRGGNIADATKMGNLNDLGGTAVNLVPINTNKGIRENPSHYAPVLGAGTAAGIVIRAFCRRPRAV